MNEEGTVTTSPEDQRPARVLARATEAQTLPVREALLQRMLHQPHGGIGGTASDIRIQAEQILYVKRILAERTAMHTGQTVEQVEADSDRDRWFTADQAKDYGFVDHVVRSAVEVPSEGAVS